MSRSPITLGHEKCRSELCQIGIDIGLELKLGALIHIPYIHNYSLCGLTRLDLKIFRSAKPAPEGSNELQWRSYRKAPGLTTSSQRPITEIPDNFS